MLLYVEQAGPRLVERKYVSTRIQRAVYLATSDQAAKEQGQLFMDAESYSCMYQKKESYSCKQLEDIFIFWSEKIILFNYQS